MTTQDWYRNSDWDEQAKDEFFRRLSRAKKHNRPQYVRIKAASLMETGVAAKIDAAIELLHLSLSEWSSERSWENDETQAALGDAYAAKGDVISALQAYERSITWDRRVLHSGYYRYAELIVEHEMKDYYDSALEVINRVAATWKLTLNSELFTYHGVRAIVFYEAAATNAHDEAKKALRYAESNTSGFSYHPSAGLVDDDEYKGIIERLRRIAVA